MRTQRARPRAALTAALMTALMTAGGCAAYEPHLYQPRPLEVALRPDADGDKARMLVSITGIRRADPKADLPRSVEVRLRIDNRGDKPVNIKPADLELFSANLKQFPDAALEPAGPIQVAPDQTADTLARFPFPDANDLDLDGLNLRWTASVGDEQVTHSATFARRDGQYEREPRFHIGVGTGIYHHRYHHPYR